MLCPALSAMLFSAALGLAPFAASADPLDEASCQRLLTERQALTVLGMDKTVEKGAVWAKEKLTVADLNLVKRYLEVIEQIKFRCEKVVALAEPEEKDEDDDDAASGAVPPMPERKTVQAAKSPAVQPAKPSAEPAAPSLVKPNTAGKGAKAAFGAASAAQMTPSRTVPAK